MRPHNSGHWTIEGARTSQFEQHLRAVLDLPLGSCAPAAPSGQFTVMANLLGGTDPDVFDRYIHVMAADPAVKVHFYGKEVRPGRKIGHVTIVGGPGRRRRGAPRPRPPRRELPPLGHRRRRLTLLSNRFALIEALVKNTIRLAW